MPHNAASRTGRTIHIIRHAQSAANAGEATHDPALIPLTALGQQQAQALATRLPPRPVAVVASHYIRAQETARPYCERWQRAAALNPLLHEFVTLSPALVAGTTMQERKPQVDAYWEASDPAARHGADSETFAEFAGRVRAFRQQMAALPDGALVFGHGMWFAMLIWQLQGFGYADSTAMRAFRRYQLALPIPNCGVYALRSQELGPGQDDWAVRFDEALYRQLHHGDQQSEARAAVMAGA